MYNYYRNRSNKLKNTLTKNYFKQKFKILKISIKQTWEFINEIIKIRKNHYISQTSTTQLLIAKRMSADLVMLDMT